MFFPFTYIVSSLLSLSLVDFFHQEFTVHKLGLGPNPHLGREHESSLNKETQDPNLNLKFYLKSLC